MPDEHTPVSRKLRAHPAGAVVASKSTFSIEFVELSSTFVLASNIFGFPWAARHFWQGSWNVALAAVPFLERCGEARLAAKNFWRVARHFWQGSWNVALAAERFL